MNTAKLIYQESQILPENLQAEVLDFIGYLKSRYVVEPETADFQSKITVLESAFAPYRKSLTGFTFNRDEANER
ncbi:hypothetical protein A1353_05290 [Methylomonas methanica]|uniref:DUF2281 domain-containing protein n=1 Tax=Methylomonas methanica TaxID=421 RepID=A0A177MU08_METMH|nr:DUF2281 domain-containing protein [Methylomonas methanica]OAI08985.1 hypothetical protein A1353_05290 [Methylomonas methanica]